MCRAVVGAADHQRLMQELEGKLEESRNLLRVTREDFEQERDDFNSTIADLRAQLLQARLHSDEDNNAVAAAKEQVRNAEEAQEAARSKSIKLSRQLEESMAATREASGRLSTANKRLSELNSEVAAVRCTAVCARTDRERTCLCVFCRLRNCGRVSLQQKAPPSRHVQKWSICASCTLGWRTTTPP